MCAALAPCVASSRMMPRAKGGRSTNHLLPCTQCLVEGMGANFVPGALFSFSMLWLKTAHLPFRRGDHPGFPLFYKHREQDTFVGRIHKAQGSVGSRMPLWDRSSFLGPNAPEMKMDARLTGPLLLNPALQE